MSSGHRSWVLIISWESCFGWAGAGSSSLGLADGWWAGDERIWLPAPPCLRSVLILLWFTPQPWSFRIPPPVSRLPCPLSVKAAEIQVEAVRPGQGQPPLQHHAPCLLVNCSENWICLLALNCLEETLCKGQNWMNRFSVFDYMNHHLKFTCRH